MYVLCMSFLCGDCLLPTYSERLGQYCMISENCCYTYCLMKHSYIICVSFLLSSLKSWYFPTSVPCLSLSSGTDEERGIKAWREAHSTSGNDIRESVDDADCPTDVAANGMDDSSSRPKTAEELEAANWRTTDEDYFLSEDDVYSFQFFKGRCSGRFWGFIPFLPPNVTAMRDA